MQRPSQLVITTSGNSQPVPLDYYTNGYAIGVTMKTAGIIYTLQFSMDDPNFDAQGNRYTNSYNVSGAWFNSSDATMVAASANNTSNFAFPPRAVRLSVSSKVSANNPLVLTIIPVGADGG